MTITVHDNIIGKVRKERLEMFHKQISAQQTSFSDGKCVKQCMLKVVDII